MCQGSWPLTAMDRMWAVSYTHLTSRSDSPSPSPSPTHSPSTQAPDRAAGQSASSSQARAPAVGAAQQRPVRRFPTIMVAHRRLLISTALLHPGPQATRRIPVDAGRHAPTRIDLINPRRRSTNDLSKRSTVSWITCRRSRGSRRCVGITSGWISRDFWFVPGPSLWQERPRFEVPVGTFGG